MFPDLSASCWRYSLILIVHQLAVVLTLHLLPRLPELLTAETDGEDRNLLMLHTTNIYCSNCSSVRSTSQETTVINCSIDTEQVQLLKCEQL